MTVDELNVKISADAAVFRSEVASANNELQTFKNRAVAAAADISKAFNGIVSVTASVVSGNETSPKPLKLPELTIPMGPIKQELPASQPEKDSTVPAVFTPDAAFDFRTAAPQRTADVLALERADTLIGAVSSDNSDAQPVNVTASVMLDGDKVGESVNRFLIRRNKITNGLGSMI